MTAFDAAGGHAVRYAPEWMRKALEASSTPAAPGIDVEQFREAVELLAWQNEGHANPDFPRGDAKKHAEALRLLALIDASPKGYARTPKAGEQIADILIEWRRNEIDAGSALAAIEAHLDACTFQPANDLNIGYEAGMRLAREAQGASPNGVSQE